VVKADGGKTYIEDIWEFDDFVEIAEAIECDASLEHIQKAMEQIVRNYDTNYGITWDSIAAAIQQVINEEK